MTLVVPIGADPPFLLLKVSPQPFWRVWSISAGWQRDSPVRGAGYEPFDSILCPNRSQKSQEISIRRSSNDVRTLRDQESHRAEFSPMRQFLLLTITIDLQRRLMTCRCLKDEKILLVIRQFRWRVWELWLQVIEEFAIRRLRWYRNVFITSTVSSSNWWKDIR